MKIPAPTNKFKIILFSLLLFGFICYTRLSFHSRYLYSWDSVSFALSLEHFDVRLHQPHPPGYILYSFTVRLLNYLVNDPNMSMILLNIFCTTAACIFIALSVAELVPANKIWLPAGAALIYATNPISWFSSSIAEIYPVEGFFASLIMYLVLASRKEARFIIWASVAMAIAGGFRPTTEIFLAPFYLIGLFTQNSKKIIQCLIILIVLNAAWFFALTSLSGGTTKYIESVRKQTTGFSEKTSPSETQEVGPAGNIPFKLLQAATIPMLFAVLLRIYRLRLTKERLWLFAILMPSILFFFQVYYAKDGYLLILIPTVIVLFTTLLSDLYTGRIVFCLVIFSAILINVFTFTKGFPASTIGSRNFAVNALSIPNYRIIQQRVNRLEHFFGLIENLNPSKKRIFVLQQRHYFPNWRMVCWYFPADYVVLPLNQGRKAYWASSHKYSIIKTPIRIPPDSWLIAIGRGKPEIDMNSFDVEGFNYYYVDSNNLPKKFVLYSATFLQDRTQK